MRKRKKVTSKDMIEVLIITHQEPIGRMASV